MEMILEFFITVGYLQNNEIQYPPLTPPGRGVSLRFLELCLTINFLCFCYFQNSTPTSPKGAEKKHFSLYIIACFIIILLLNSSSTAIPLLGGDKGVGKLIKMAKRKIIWYDPKLKPLAKKLRKNMTLSEVLLWNELKNKQMRGYDFDRQRPIDRYIVDFYCKDLMMAIEVDGESHGYDKVMASDQIRQRRLEKLGVMFLRIDDLDVKKNMKWVLNEIWFWIEEHGG